MEQVKVYSMLGTKIDLTTVELPPQQVLETQKDQLNTNVMNIYGSALVVADMDGRVTHLGSGVSAKFVVERLGWHVEGYVAAVQKPSKVDEAKKAMPKVVERSVKADGEEVPEKESSRGAEKITPEKARQMAAATVVSSVGGAESEKDEEKPSEEKPSEDAPSEVPVEEDKKGADESESKSKKKSKKKSS